MVQLYLLKIELHNGEAKFLAEGYENFDYAFSMHLRKHVRLPNYKSVQCRSPWWIAEQVAVSRRYLLNLLNIALIVNLIIYQGKY